MHTEPNNSPRQLCLVQSIHELGCVHTSQPVIRITKLTNNRNLFIQQNYHNNKRTAESSAAKTQINEQSKKKKRK